MSTEHSSSKFFKLETHPAKKVNKLENSSSKFSKLETHPAEYGILVYADIHKALPIYIEKIKFFLSAHA